MYFEDDLAVGRHRNAVAIGQCQGLVVIEHRVQVLDPDGVDRAVQQQPDVITLQHSMIWVRIAKELEVQPPVIVMTPSSPLLLHRVPSSFSTLTASVTKIHFITNKAIVCIVGSAHGRHHLHDKLV